MADGAVQTATATALPAEVLRTWATQALERAGASAAAAAATTDALASASARGVDSHGFGLVPTYVDRLLSGKVDGAAVPEVVVDAPALALVDGHLALGAYVATEAMRLCCEKAHAHGAAVVAVRRSTHFGPAAHYAGAAAERGCLGLIVSNSDPGLAPLGALAPLLGTNPLAIAAPPGDVAPAPLLDMATSIVAQGRVVRAAKAGQRIPLDWAIGPDGAPTDDPEAALANAVLPLGGYKGFGLAFMIDVLAGCFAGALLSPEIREEENVGHVLIAIDVAAGGDAAGYRARLDRLLGFVHDAPRRADAEPFLIPGEREGRVARERDGLIPLDPPMRDALAQAGARVGVPLPAPAPTPIPR